MKIVNILLSLILLLLTTSCSKKARTNVEMRTMIVGEWTRKYPLRANIEVRLTFYEDGRFSKFYYNNDSIITVGSKKRKICCPILLTDTTGSGFFVDSIRYEIINGRLFFMRNNGDIYYPLDRITPDNDSYSLIIYADKILFSSKKAENNNIKPMKRILKSTPKIKKYEKK